MKKFVLALLCLFAVVATLQAQYRGRGLGGYGGYSYRFATPFYNTSSFYAAPFYGSACYTPTAYVPTYAAVAAPCPTVAAAPCAPVATAAAPCDTGFSGAYGGYGMSYGGYGVGLGYGIGFRRGFYAFRPGHVRHR